MRGEVNVLKESLGIKNREIEVERQRGEGLLR